MRRVWRSVKPSDGYYSGTPNNLRTAGSGGEGGPRLKIRLVFSVSAPVRAVRIFGRSNIRRAAADGGNILLGQVYYDSARPPNASVVVVVAPPDGVDDLQRSPPTRTKTVLFVGPASVPKTDEKNKKHSENIISGVGSWRGAARRFPLCAFNIYTRQR